MKIKEEAISPKKPEIKINIRNPTGLRFLDCLDLLFFLETSSTISSIFTSFLSVLNSAIIKSVSRNDNKGENSSLKRIGNFIKEARLSRNQSIEELASNLKIGAHQLEAIEEGNEEKLPEKVFVKAMVRRISQKLKIDTEFIMDEFKTERKEVKIEEIVEEVSKKNYKSSQSKNLNPVGFLIFILISGFLGLIASSLIFNLFSDSSQNQTPKQEVIKN